MNTKKTNGYSLGMIGLGTMGRNLLLNMADNGFKVTGYDKNADMIALLKDEGKAHQLEAFDDIETFISRIETPRTIILLVPAGPIVDSVVEELKPLLSPGDVICDSGNSHFTDTARRAEELAKIGLHFFGMGISGGEEGARRGPSMMPGGDKAAYKVVKKMFEAISAKADGDPCVTYIGPGASGHFVKMVHNGIEYALMQLIAETYDILKRGLGYTNAEIHQVFDKWNKGRLRSFLIETTKDIFAFKDVKTGKYLVDVIRDEAKSKGTGKWTSQVAMDIEVPIPTIDAAVSTRNLSKMKAMRTQLASAYAHRQPSIKEDISVKDLEHAFYFAMVAAYAQGMHLLREASIVYSYDLQLDEIAKIWRGGCIIRAAFLSDIHQAYTNKELVHLYEDPAINKAIKTALKPTRNVICAVSAAGLAIPAFASSLTYFDSIITERMPSNLTQAQRDYFGAHTYQRTDEEGIFHADWTNKVK